MMELLLVVNKGNDVELKRLTVVIQASLDYPNIGLFRNQPTKIFGQIF